MLSARLWQVLLIASTIGLCWLLMMVLHELGHVLNAWLSGGRVQRVVLHPLAISRTDVSPNPHPQFVAWGGALWGAAIPLAIYGIVWRLAPKIEMLYLLTFFAGFCCLANGLYLAVGAFYPVGDAADLLRLGARRWQLVALGGPLAVLGLWLWHGLGSGFGPGTAPQRIHPRLALCVTFAFLLLAALLFLLSAR